MSATEVTEVSEVKEETIETVEIEQPWGRVLICGGMNWSTNGKKDRPADTTTDLRFPHILRSICHIKVVRIITGPAANYAVAIDIHGIAHLFGRLPTASLVPGNTDVVSEHTPMKVSPRSVGLPKGVKWVDGAAARSHTLLVASDGSVWGCGNNVFGQLGLPPGQEVDKWTRITGPWSKTPDCNIIQVTSGHTFSLFLTNTGQIFAAGSSESGQLGNGKTGERILKGGRTGFDIESPPRLVGGLSGKKMKQIASGNQHSLAMDEEGYVYAWGYAGYSRLGLQDQKDRLVPTIVPSFTGKNELTRAEKIVCGPANSIVVDRQGMYYMAGKWKTTGDGSHGQPYTYFKTIQDIMGCKVIKAASGGCTHFFTTPDPEGGVMTAAFGQGCLYGELGLGPDAGKSCTKATKVEPLVGIDVIDIAAGAFCTLFLARPNAELPEVPRWPIHIKTPDICIICKVREGDPLECERCDMPHHFYCLDPPLNAVPEGEWFCPQCEKEMETSPEEEEEMADRQTSHGPGSKNVKRESTPKGTPKATPNKGRGKSGTPASKTKSGPTSARQQLSAEGGGGGGGPSGSGRSPSGSPSRTIGKRKAEDEVAGGRKKSKLGMEISEIGDDDGDFEDGNE